MTNQPTEIAIVGGGMVGGALALGLAQHGFSVTVIEHAEPAPFVADSQPDVRISAISAASVSLLKGLGVWDAVQAVSYTHLDVYKRQRVDNPGVQRATFITQLTVQCFEERLLINFQIGYRRLRPDNQR